MDLFNTILMPYGFVGFNCFSGGNLSTTQQWEPVHCAMYSLGQWSRFSRKPEPSSPYVDLLVSLGSERDQKGCQIMASLPSLHLFSIPQQSLAQYCRCWAYYARFCVGKGDSFYLKCILYMCVFEFNLDKNLFLYLITWRETSKN